jgi:N-acetylglucosamine malate deacetylase 2
VSGLPRWKHPLVVVAHPDDESFGLGAVLDQFVTAGAEVSVVCFTHGEASTLHGTPGDLRGIRARELRAAAGELRLGQIDLLDEADGALPVQGPGAARLSAAVARTAGVHAADGLLVFDLGGVTGHPDHDAATAAALAAAAQLDLPVLAWVLPERVAEQLNVEFGAAFRGRPDREIDLVVQVSRERQLRAVACHPSQAVPGSVLWRRLDLLGQTEYLRWLRAPSAVSSRANEQTLADD